MMPFPKTAALMLLLAAAPVFAASGRYCGGPVVTTVPSDLENVVGDLSLEYIVQQPASITTCAMGYLLEKCGDHETANMVFDKCIAAGYVGSMIWKALAYENGNGVPRDYAKAAQLLRQAAQSEGSAYSTLGKLHYATVLYQGKGVERDVDEAMKWFRAAAAEGDPDAREFLRTGYHTAARDESGQGVGTPPPVAASVPGAAAAPAATTPAATVPAARGGAMAAAAIRKLSPATAEPPPRVEPPPVPPPQAPVEAPVADLVAGQHLARVTPTPAAALPWWSLAVLGLLMLAGAWQQARRARPLGLLRGASHG